MHRFVLAIMAIMVLSLATHVEAADKPKDVTSEWLEKIDSNVLTITKTRTITLTRVVELIHAEEKGGRIHLLLVSKGMGQEVTFKGLKNKAGIAYQPNLFRSRQTLVKKDEHKEKFIRRGLINIYLPLNIDDDEEEEDTIGTDKDPVLKPLRK